MKRPQLNLCFPNWNNLSLKQRGVLTSEMLAAGQKTLFEHVGAAPKPGTDH